jgi:hypothetical protein
VTSSGGRGCGVRACRARSTSIVLEILAGADRGRTRMKAPLSVRPNKGEEFQDYIDNGENCGYRVYKVHPERHLDAGFISRINMKR